MTRTASGRRRRGPKKPCRGSGGCACRCPGPGSRTATSGRSPPGTASSSSTPGSAARAASASSTSPSPRPASASRTSASSSAPTPTPTTTAWRRRSSRGPAASSGCTPPGSTCACSATTPPRRSSGGSRSPARAASRRPRWSATARAARTTTTPGSTRSSSPTATSLPGVEIETDLGSWQVHETPGHAPSHVVLHQPEHRLLISGDHLLGRTVLFFDYGHTPDPIGEFLGGLDEIEPLEVDLVLPGHGRPFRDPEVKIAEARRQVGELLDKCRAALAGGREDRLRDRRRDRRPRGRQLAGQRLGAADRPLRPRPPGDPRRGGRGRGNRSAALGASVASPRMASFTFAREVAAPPEVVFEVLVDHRGYADITPLRRSELEREGDPAPERRRRDPGPAPVGPPLREEVAHLRGAEPLLLHAALRGAAPRPRRHGRARPRAASGTKVTYAVRTMPTLPLVGGGRRSPSSSGRSSSSSTAS